MTNQQLTQRPDGLTIISIWFYLCGAFFILLTAVAAFLTLSTVLGAAGDGMELLIPAAMFTIIAFAFMALSILNLVVGYGIWILRPWARTGAIALAIVSLIFIPIGTITGAFILSYLLMPTTAAAFDKTTTPEPPSETTPASA